MSKRDEMRAQLAGGAAKTLDAGPSRFDRVDQTIFRGEARAEVAPPAVAIPPAPAVILTPAPEEPRKKISVTLTEKDHLAWKVKLAQEKLIGQDVLESLVQEFLAKS